MHENEITDRLLDAVAALSPQGQRRFIRSCLGVMPLPAATGALEIARRTTWLDGRDVGSKPKDVEPPTVLVTLAGDAFIADADTKTSPGSEVDGVLLWRGHLMVLLEVKKPGNPVSRNQLRRHAQTWGLDSSRLDDWSDVTEVPRGFGFVTWAALAQQLSGALGLADADIEVLAQLSAVLAQEVGGGQVIGPIGARPVVPEPLPDPTDLEALLTHIDVAAVHRICAELYGAGGTDVVEERQCIADAQRLVEAFQGNGQPVPPGLLEEGKRGRGDVMTPRRLLTSAYQGRNLGMLFGPEREVAHRLLSRGADRRVALGLWAWAAVGAQAERGAILRRTLARVWSRLPATGPAAPELAQLDVYIGHAR